MTIDFEKGKKLVAALEDWYSYSGWDDHCSQEQAGAVNWLIANAAELVSLADGWRAASGYILGDDERIVRLARERSLESSTVANLVDVIDHLCQRIQAMQSVGGKRVS